MDMLSRILENKMEEAIDLELDAQEELDAAESAYLDFVMDCGEESYDY